MAFKLALTLDSQRPTLAVRHGKGNRARRVRPAQLAEQWTTGGTTSKIYRVTKVSPDLILFGKGGCDGSATGVMSHRPEVLFVIDDSQQIVEWSNTAAVTLGVSPEAALGQRCYEVIRGHDPFGRAVCGIYCPAVKALQSGHSAGRCTLLLDQRAGQRRRFICTLAAMPKPLGGALGTLVEHSREPPATTLPAFQISAVDTAHDLAVLASLAASLSWDHFDQSLEQALKWLGETTHAEGAELFLVEPTSRDMLLAAYTGPFRNAFSQITRFHPGQGFPGLAEVTRQPILTTRLLEDPRYLRTRVKGRGFQSYVCVPILSGSGDIMGSLHVAARRSDFDTERAFRILTWASRPLSNILEVGQLQYRLAVTASSTVAPASAERSFDDLLRVVLHQMVTIGHATGGSLFLYDRDIQGLARRVVEGEPGGMTCPAIKPDNMPECPALMSGQSIALYGPRHHWPQVCQNKIAVRGGLVYCLPLTTAGETAGVIQLGYSRQAPFPPTRYLPLLLNAAEQAAPLIRHAWANLQAQEQAATRLAKWIREAEKLGGQSQALAVRSSDNILASDSGEGRPFLEIRCLGPFELYRQGKLVTPEMVQRRGALTLLKILLVHEGLPVARDALADMLWPEVDPEAGANRVYVLVHALRQVVEPSNANRHWQFIRNEGDRYYFNLDSSHRLDHQEFRQDVALGERLEREGRIADAIDSHEAAVNLYRGDLLEDEPYAEWCWEHRESLREIFLSTLKRLAALYMDRGVPERSVELYRRALKADPLRENMHQGLMEALWSAGRRSEALHQYQVCQEILLRELGVPPLPETQKLYEAIRHRHSP